MVAMQTRHSYEGNFAERSMTGFTRRPAFLPKEQAARVAA